VEPNDHKLNDYHNWLESKPERTWFDGLSARQKPLLRSMCHMAYRIPDGITEEQFLLDNDCYYKAVKLCLCGQSDYNVHDFQ